MIPDVNIFDKETGKWYNGVPPVIGDGVNEFVIGKEMRTGEPLMSGTPIERLRFMQAQRYWYVTEIATCVLCGREKKNRHRVYKEPERAGRTLFIEDACQEHFI